MTITPKFTDAPFAVVQPRQPRLDVIVNKTDTGFTVEMDEPRALPHRNRRAAQPEPQPQPTIYKVACEILSQQRAFFDRGVAGLVPLTMQTVADAIGVNVGTVSRTVAGRFMQTPTGSVMMKRFFTQGYQKADGKMICNTNVQALIGRMIDGEDSRHPLSDRIIDARLRKRGLPVARRTVSKYRAALGLPAFQSRRKSFVTSGADHQ